MPDSPERGTREAARRQAVDTLNIASAIAGYAAGAVADGLSPEAARRAVVDAAAELELAASRLRRLAGRPRAPDTGARRAVAAELAAAGVPAAQVAVRLGVHPSTVRKWRHRAAGLLRSVTRGGADIIGPKRKRAGRCYQHRDPGPNRDWTSAMDNPVSTPGRYEAREVTRLGVRLVECVWIPQGGPPGAALFAVAAERVPLIAAAIDAWLHRGEA